MSDEPEALTGSEAISYPSASDAPMTVEEAARDLASAREKALNPTAESAEAATADPELAQANAESPEEETISEDQEVEPAKPAIDPPKSWTKDLHEHWNALDPVLQERIVARDREDQVAIKRAFNEAADDRKAIKVEREAAEQARKQYEAQLPALMQTLQDAQQASFGDIKTVADVERLQAEDPFRFQAWQVQQMKLQAAHAESERVKSQQTQKQQTDWNQHVQKENELAAELIPELANKEKAPDFYKRAVDRLKELGFKQEEVNDLATGKERLSIHDHRLQMLLASDFRHADIQKAKAVATAKPVPPVQRPGTSKPAGAGVNAQIQALEKQLSTASGDNAARISADIYRLEKKAASR